MTVLYVVPVAVGRCLSIVVGDKVRDKPRVTDQLLRVELPRPAHLRVGVRVRSDIDNGYQISRQSVGWVVPTPSPESLSLSGRLLDPQKKVI